jgi:TldD protein
MNEPRYYDLRRVAGEATHVDIDNGVIESAGISFFDHLVVRALSGTGWGVHTLDNSGYTGGKPPREWIDNAASMGAMTSFPVSLGNAESRALPIPQMGEDPRNVGLEEKSELLGRIEKAARAHGISNTRAQYIERAETVVFHDSFGNEYDYEVVRCGFSVLAVAARGGVMQMASEREHTLAGLNIRHKEETGSLVSGRALALLDAVPAKGGRMNAVLDPELGGVFAHEAVGHASEGDLVLEGNSVLKGRIGEKIGFSGLNIIDDPTMPGFGFEPVDAEGVSVVKTEIIKKGVVNAYLLNKETMASVGQGMPGHARAMPGDVPIVRMSNTYIDNGDSSLDELVAECKSGILLKGSRGGQVDPGRGVFQFNAEYGFLIDHGETGAMVRDVSLSGEILSTLHQIGLVGNDLKMSAGYCGKAGQTVPVSDGAPHVLLFDAVVGGSG